ncbi:MAG: PLP-dependent aspartate aminotransferase family protein [Verrucomicrobiota bacterium]
MTDKKSQYSFETNAIHGGLDWRDETGSVIPPIYQTSTFEYGNAGGFDYTRSGNPNFRNLDAVVAASEEAVFCTSFASGVSAITAVVSTLKSGDVVLAEENIYGCTYRLFEQVFQKFGVAVQYVDFSTEDGLAAITSIKPKLIWIESPTNPLLKVLDVGRISKLAKAMKADVLVDNTFASSYLQQPLELGATLSLLSTTKYTNGHSDALGGAVCTNSEEWQDKMIFAQKALGLQPSPFDAWLTLRGAKTQQIRMERHSRNALRVAEFLESQTRVNWVRYPFLKSHPQYKLAKKQMKGGSGIITMELHCSKESALEFCKELTLFAMAESLGGIESLVCHPATMTHASVPEHVRQAVGISDSLVRLSVGIENEGDLVTDLGQALEVF